MDKEIKAGQVWLGPRGYGEYIVTAVGYYDWYTVEGITSHKKWGVTGYHLRKYYTLSE